jgi:hypothetical protein
LAGNGVETLGLDSGSGIEDGQTALDIVNAAILSYCPQYNSTIADG